MRIVISGIAGAKPVVLDGMKAVILAADDNSPDGTAPTIAHGNRTTIARLATLVLLSIRDKLGEETFEAVVRAARKENPRLEDITDSVLAALPEKP